jgi:hypothetical protein
MIGKKMIPVASILLLCVAGNALASESSKSVLSDAQAATDVRVSDVRAHNGVVTGTLVNTSRTPVRNVELLVRRTWFWSNERHPGNDNPGRADVYAVRAEIPPHEQMPFTYQVSPPLPQRDDGHFQTTVEVVGFAQVGR